MRCPFCGYNLNEKLIYLVKSQISDKAVRYGVCSKCRSLLQLDKPDFDEITAYYENYLSIKEKMNPGYLNQKDTAPFFKERDKTLSEINFDMNRIIDGRSVEVGCANGDFLNYLYYKGGRNITGIDVSHSLTKSIDNNKFRVICGDLSQIESNSIDNLFAFNLIEHLSDPDIFVEHVSRVLVKKGVFVIEIPLSGIISSFFGSKWRFLMPDEHLSIPSVKAITYLLKTKGFEKKGSTRFGSGFTTGMINNSLKRIFDKYAKLFKFGDRGAYLFIKK